MFICEVVHQDFLNSVLAGVGHEAGEGYKVACEMISSTQNLSYPSSD
jgi:hypothetical protein